MEINIDIKKSEVYGEVIKVTNYAAKKVLTGDEAKDTIVYERIAANELNDELFDKFFEDAKSDVLRETGFYQYAMPLFTKNEEDGLYLTLKMPRNWDATQHATLEASCNSYFIDFIVSRWMRLVNFEEEKKYAADCIGEMNNVRIALNRRKRPSMRKEMDWCYCSNDC